MTLHRRGFLAGMTMLPAAAHAANLRGPDLEGSVAELGIWDLATALRRGELSAERHVSVLLDRIQRASGLNAFISVYGIEALEAARRVDQARHRGVRLPPLAGVPVVVKDNIDLAGQVTTAGTPALRNSRPNDTAPVLQALFSGRMILLGKTNMQELALGITSQNVAYGFVHNPYDTSRVPGGSSGGTGAAVAARLAPGGLGTDTGGSVRVPAAFCGIAGLRPSVGNGGADRRYTASGVAPISPTRDTPGPMARSVKDVALLDATITGGQLPRRASLAGVRLGVPRAGFWENLDAEVERVCTEALRRLREAGVILVEADLGDVFTLDQQAGFPIALYEIGQAFPAYLRQISSDITYEQVVAQAAGPDVKAILAAAATVQQDAYLTALNIDRPRLQAAYASYFSAQGVDGVIFPTTPVPAPPIDPTFSGEIDVNGVPQTAGEFNTVIRNTDPGSVAGIPGITLPAGLTSGGLPVGLAIDGPVRSDARLLAIGMAIEEVLGRLPAPLV